MIFMRSMVFMRSTVLVAGPWIRSHTSEVRDAARRASTKTELGGNQGPAGGEAASSGGEAADGYC